MQDHSCTYVADVTHLGLYCRVRGVTPITFARLNTLAHLILSLVLYLMHTCFFFFHAFISSMDSYCVLKSAYLFQVGGTP